MSLETYAERLCNNARQRAHRKGRECDVSWNHILDLLRKHPECQICGMRFYYNSYDMKPTLDRINNRNGYVYGNIGIVCFECNQLKASYSQLGVKHIIRKGKENGGTCVTRRPYAKKKWAKKPVEYWNRVLEYMQTKHEVSYDAWFEM